MGLSSILQGVLGYFLAYTSIMIGLEIRLGLLSCNMENNYTVLVNDEELYSLLSLILTYYRLLGKVARLPVSKPS